ncbi:radical SAM protein [Yoonia sp. R2331]|uniref:radical SAM protein n=1 Tax=Yoonia sp. R2331 TaxID=3237238 RepID=UPI0034E59DE5
MALMARRVVHIHPTLLCNLTCAHCYSTSSPQMPRGLDPEHILQATAKMAADGYDSASLSGGEPTIYFGLDRLCGGLREQGFAVSVITNGLQPRRIAGFADQHQPDLISVSFDGLAPRHDLIRRKQGSFDRAMETLKTLADKGHACGAVVSLGEDGMEDIPALVAQIAAAGARHVQLHPVSELGRGLTSAIVKEPSDETLLRAMVLSQLLDVIHPDCRIICDALTGELLQAKPRPKVGDLVSPVVIGADGKVFPVAYGLAEHFSFGNVRDGLSPTVYAPELVDLIDRCWDAAATREATAFYPDLTRLSQTLVPG